MKQTSPILIPPISPEDIAQEAALYELETGKRPSKRYIYMHLKSRELLFEPVTEADEALVINKFPFNEKPSEEVIEALVKWALETKAVNENLYFLQSAEERLEETIQILTDRGLINGKGRRKGKRKQQTQKPKSLSQMIREEYLRGKSVEEIIEMIRPYSIKRPEALVRTVLRNMSGGQK